MECVNASLVSPLLSRLRRQVDIILFNPPYVPTVNEEAQIAQQEKGISGAWAGGHDGMGVTNAFLDIVKVCIGGLRVSGYFIVGLGRIYCPRTGVFTSSL